MGPFYFDINIPETNHRRHGILANLAELCFRMRSYDDSLKYCLEARSEKPGFAEVLGLEAQVHIIKGDFAAAEQLLLEAKALSPDLPHLWYHLGRCYLGQENYEQARKAFMVEREESPDMASVHHFLGKIALKKKDFKDAEESLQRAARLNPCNLDLLNELALVLEYNGKISAAIDIFESMGRLDPSIVGLQSKIDELSMRKRGEEKEEVYTRQEINQISCT